MTAFGFLAIHVVGFGPVSDPYADFGANALSWVLLIAPLLTSLVVAAIAGRELARARPAAAV